MRIKVISIICAIFCFASAFSVEPIKPNFELKSPKEFTAKFETTKGDFEIKAKREWSPLAVDRLYQLLKSDFFDNIIIYRGVENFVIQFGTADTLLDQAWSAHKIIDEAVLKGNELGVMSFARADKETRGTQLFINLKNNPRLDTINAAGVIGYPGIALVTAGLEVVKSMCTEYGNEPMIKMDSLKTSGNDFLKKNYPHLDVIKKAYITKE